MKVLLCVSVLWSLTAFGSERTKTELSNDRNEYLGGGVWRATYVTQGNPLPSNATGGTFMLSVKVNDRSDSMYAEVDALDVDGNVDASGRFALYDARGIAMGSGKCSAQEFRGGGPSKVYLSRSVNHMYLIGGLTICDMMFLTPGIGGSLVQLRLVFRGKGIFTKEEDIGKLLLIDGSISKNSIDGYKYLDWEVFTTLGEDSQGDCGTDTGVNDCYGGNF